MLPLILTLLVVALGLVALLWTGTVLGQGFIYDSTTDGLYWRAPAAAGAMTLFLGIWAFIDYRMPRTTDTIFSFSNEHAEPIDKFTSVRRSEVGEEKEIQFTRRTMGGSRYEFVDGNGERWSRSKSGMMVAIIVEEKKGDQVVKTRFNAEMRDGKFAPQKAGGIEQALRYVEEGGKRYIFESQLGKIISYHKSQLLGNVVINGLHLACWFAVLWLLLRFTWSHALGFAVICWLVMTLTILPYVLSKSREAADKRPKQSAMLVAPSWNSGRLA